MATLLTKRLIFLSIFSLFTFSLVNCNKKESEPIEEIKDGFFVVCEGNFNWGNTSISSVNVDNETIDLTQKYFELVNGYSLGDITQSMYSLEDKYVIVVNNSSKIEIVDKSDFTVLTTITELESPRYFIPINDSIGYVSDLYNNAIHIINYQMGNKLGEVPVNGWSEQMSLLEDSVYVALYDSQSVGVVSTSSNEIITEIPLDLSPTAMKKDKNDKLWVTGSEFGGESKLYRIDPTMRTVEMSLLFEEDDGLSYMDIPENSSFIYLVSTQGKVYKMSIDSESLPSALFTVSVSGLYGLNVDAEGGIFICEALDFVQKGRVTKFNESGEIQYSVTSGIGPNSVIFR